MSTYDDLFILLGNIPCEINRENIKMTLAITLLTAQESKSDPTTYLERGYFVT